MKQRTAIESDPIQNDDAADRRRTASGPSNILIALCAVVALGFSVFFAYYYVFSRSMSLDEGWLMITVQGFSTGHPLYDSVFTLYGPFYYCYEWLLHSLGHVPLTHDATRLICVVHWLITATLLGWATQRMTRSSLAGLFAGVQSFVHLAPLAHEPGHPQEVVAMLLALSAVVASFDVRRRGTQIMLGAVAAALVFTKVNAGVFFGLALVLVMWFHSRLAMGRSAGGWIIGIACAALPFLLMRNHLDMPWARTYALVAAGTLFAVVFASQRNATRDAVTGKDFTAIALAMFAVAAVLAAATLITGTSLSKLVQGVILGPLRLPAIAVRPLELNPMVLVGCVASWAVMALVFGRQRTAGLEMLVGGLKFAYALIGGFWLITQPGAQIGYLLPWLWLVVVPDREGSWRAPESFGRIFLCLAAAWQSLQAYPVAGTQMTIGTLLLAPICTLCVTDGIRLLVSSHRPGTGVPKTEGSARALFIVRPGVLRLAEAFAAITLILLLNVWCDLPALRRQYAALPPVDLPGSRRVHMDEEAVTMYRGLAEYLRRECDTFVVYPGVNSLYFWAEKSPPTQLNPTGWGLLTHAQQQQILTTASQAQRLKVVIVEAVMQNWTEPAFEPIRPLVRYVTEECRPVKRIGRYVVFERKSAATTSNR